MLTKNRYFITLISICTAILTMSLQKCNRDDIPTPKPTYDFAEKFTLTPYKKTYAINDTIWLQFKTNDKKLFDRISNSKVTTDTTNLHLYFNYYKRYPMSFNQGDIFCSAIVTGNVNNTSFTKPLFYNIVETQTDCNSNFYFVKVGFVPKDKGIFSIAAPSGQVNNCPNKVLFNYAKYFFTFDLADCNKDVYLSIPASARGGEQGFVDVSIDRKQLFVFKVE